jgi:DNA replication protein DnaC
MEHINNIISLPVRRERTGPAPVAETPVVAVPLCPRCNGRGWTRDDVPFGHPHFGKALPCECKLRERAKRARDRFGGSQMPEDASWWTFSTFPKFGDLEALAEVQAFADGMTQGQRGLYLFGPLGTGKTGLACCVGKAFEASGGAARYITAREFLDEVNHARYDEDGDKSFLEVMYGVDCLILDEIGIERTTTAAIGEIGELLDKRRARKLWTVLVSNRSPEALLERWTQAAQRNGEDTLDAERIVDRILYEPYWCVCEVVKRIRGRM